MFKKILYSSTLATALLLSACGDNSSSATSSDFTIKGKVIDGYIKNAIVCLDLNSDGLCNVNEPSVRSGSDGSYSLGLTQEQIDKAKSQKLPILAYGGIDLDTNESYSGKLEAIVDENSSVHITPLTTLSFNSYKAGLSKGAAIAQTAATLGIDESEITADYKKDAGHEAALKKALTTQKTLEALYGKDSTKIAQGYATLGQQIKKSDANSVDITSLFSELNATNIATFLNNTLQNGISNEKIKIAVDALANNQDINKTKNIIDTIGNSDVNTTEGKRKYIIALLQAADYNVSAPINQISDTLVAQINLNDDISTIAKQIHDSNPSLIKSTATTVVSLAKSSGIEIAKTFFTQGFSDVVHGDANISDIFSVNALFTSALKQGFLSNVVEQSNLKDVIATKSQPDPLIETAIKTTLIGVDTSSSGVQAAIDFLASIDYSKMLGFSGSGTTSTIISLVSTLLPSGIKPSADTNQTSTKPQDSFLVAWGKKQAIKTGLSTLGITADSAIIDKIYELSANLDFSHPLSLATQVYDIYKGLQQK